MDSYTSMVLLPSGRIVNTANIAYSSLEYDDSDTLVRVVWYMNNSRLLPIGKQDSLDLYTYLTIFALDVGSQIGR